MSASAVVVIHALRFQRVLGLFGLNSRTAPWR
jgi:hypothetical protein